MHESPFETSPFIAEKGFQGESDVFWSTNKPLNRNLRAHDEGSPMRAAIFEKEVSGKDNTSGLARIKVVVGIMAIFLQLPRVYSLNMDNNSVSIFL
jgi:hypothetical protein